MQGVSDPAMPVRSQLGHGRMLGQHSDDTLEEIAEQQRINDQDTRNDGRNGQQHQRQCDDPR